MTFAKLCLIPRNSIRIIRFSAVLIANFDPKMLSHFLLVFYLVPYCILETVLGKSSGSTCGELTIFLHLSYPDNSSVFSVLSAYRYTFGKPVPGYVSFRVCRKFEHPATACYGEEAKAVCDEFSGQVNFEYSSGGVIGENVAYWACLVGINLLCWSV